MVSTWVAKPEERAEAQITS